MTDIERFGREGKINDEYEAPEMEPFVEKEHLRWWLGDANGSSGKDQFIMYRGDNVGVFWNRKAAAPDNIVDRQHWTESFVQWSPLGTFLTSMHQQGVQLWGGRSWGRQKRFAHPFVNLVDFSPSEKYITTWSNRPIQVDERNPSLTVEEEGKNYVIWDIDTGKPLRSFANIDPPGPAQDEAGNPIKRKVQWPAFKWSADDKYVARLSPGQSISVYELPRMILLDKVSIKIEGVVDFEWAPADPHRDGVKTYEQLFCYWTPEIGSNPAKVGLMSIPSKEIVRTRNLFNVSDAKLHWQSHAAYLCVKVDRHSKSKKSLATNLEIFRVKEKGVPVEVVDSIKDTVINFAWEPKGDRFVLITTAEVLAATAVPPKTSVSFFCPEKVRGNVVGNFKHVRTVDKKNSNAIYWSPKGRFVIVATVHSQQSFDMDFWDMDFEGERTDSEKDLTANLQLMNTAEHFGVTDIDWDPTGRYVATSASMWKHSVSLDSSSQSSLTNNRSRWKMAIIFMISKALSFAKSTLNDSSNGFGDQDLRLCCPRRSRSRFEKIFENTAKNLNWRINMSSILPILQWWKREGDCLMSGLPGGEGKKKWQDSNVKIWVCQKIQMRPLIQREKMERLRMRW
jgi:translation initiation factor 3 subunit B